MTNLEEILARLESLPGGYSMDDIAKEFERLIANNNDLVDTLDQIGRAVGLTRKERPFVAGEVLIEAVSRLIAQRDAKQLNHEYECHAFTSEPCTCGFSGLREREAKLKQENSRLIVAAQLGEAAVLGKSAAEHTVARLIAERDAAKEHRDGNDPIWQAFTEDAKSLRTQLAAAEQRAEAAELALKNKCGISGMEEGYFCEKARTAIAEREVAEAKPLDYPQKIFSHKYLDPSCIENGCQSLLISDLEDKLAASQAREKKLREALADMLPLVGRSILGDHYESCVEGIAKARAALEPPKDVTEAGKP